jgi:hypothetical protein
MIELLFDCAGVITPEPVTPGSAYFMHASSSQTQSGDDSGDGKPGRYSIALRWITWHIALPGALRAVRLMPTNFRSVLSQSADSETVQETTVHKPVSATPPAYPSHISLDDLSAKQVQALDLMFLGMRLSRGSPPPCRQCRLGVLTFDGPYRILPVGND